MGDSQPLACETCSGTGSLHRRTCPDCSGRGDVSCSLCPHHEPATRMGGDEPTCEACGALCDADLAAYQATLCPAGQDHDELRTTDAWFTLHYVGVQHIGADDSGPAETLELRNCACHSTLARVVTERMAA